ncbi:hypothetical protein IQ07DRAFT_497431 [Pyrenochaeta sp. DS3sAY3a]|nr:hypothetical protein IQ07DRAFT_497431 [Pyrenochaeta sp. DS3sAY3a]
MVKHSRNDSQHLEERQLHVVRIADITQSALSGKVEEEMTDIEQELPAISVLGFIAGTIVQFGPEYLSLMRSLAAAQDWTNCWTDHYQTDIDLETLRIINEEFTEIVLGYEDADLAQVRNMRNRHVSAWPVGGGDGRKPKQQCSSQLQSQESSSIKGPWIFLGTSYVMGLAPSAAVVGDVVVRFWNCNAALLCDP